MSQNLEAELSIGPSAINAYSRLSYTMWFALAEFVDNSTQSRLNYDQLIDEALKAEGQPLTVDIVHNRQTKEITIADNSIGMSRDDLVAALRIATPTADSKGRSKYGMGMKTAACWIGNKWKISTCELGSGEEWTASVNVDHVAHQGAKVPLTVREVSRDEHYTRITISDLRRVVQKRSEETIKTYLGSMYMFDLRPDDKGQVLLKLTYNGEEITPPQEMDWDTDPQGLVMKRDLPEIKIEGKTIKGWFGILRKGGRKFGGFSFFQNGRQIQGFPKAWKPNSIFGGVDDEGANNLISQRLTGVLLLDGGFAVSHTKDMIQWQGDEEDTLERYLIDQTRDFVEYAKTRRGTSAGKRWSKEKLRDFVDSMTVEFNSPEVQDALNSAALPPPEAMDANNAQLLNSLTPEDELKRWQILPDLQVIISAKETSEWEPYVSYVPGSGPGIIHVIINGLHPYYQTLEANDAIEECIHQFMFDAVSEFKASKLVARVNPNSVRRIKENLLRARATQLDNADADVRDNAAAQVMNAPPTPPNDAQP